MVRAYLEDEPSSLACSIIRHAPFSCMAKTVSNMDLIWGLEEGSEASEVPSINNNVNLVDFEKG